MTEFFLRQFVAYVQREQKVVSFKKRPFQRSSPSKKNRQNVTKKNPPPAPLFGVNNNIAEFLVKKKLFLNNKNLSPHPPNFSFEIHFYHPSVFVDFFEKSPNIPWTPGTEKRKVHPDPGTHLYHSRSQRFWRVLVRQWCVCFFFSGFLGIFPGIFRDSWGIIRDF